MKTKTTMMILRTIGILFLLIAGTACSDMMADLETLSKKEARTAWKWTVTFDSQGATTEATPTIKTVEKPAVTIDALPTAPAKTGSEFAGWWTAINGGGTEFTATTTVGTNLSVYAKWSEKPVYIVTFDSDGGSAVGEQHVTLPATTVAALPAAPTKAGHTFAGWWTAINGGGTEFTASTAVTASLTIWAKWKSKTRTIFQSINF